MPTIIPAKSHKFALYLHFISKIKDSESAIEEACNAVFWVHSTPGLPPVLSDCLVKAPLDGWRRSVVKPIVKKERKLLECWKLLWMMREVRITVRLWLVMASLLGFAVQQRYWNSGHVIGGDAEGVHHRQQDGPTEARWWGVAGQN